MDRTGSKPVIELMKKLGMETDMPAAPAMITLLFQPIVIPLEKLISMKTLFPLNYILKFNPDYALEFRYEAQKCEKIWHFEWET